jgi:hypothetical protein
VSVAVLLAGALASLAAGKPAPSPTPVPEPPRVTVEVVAVEVVGPGLGEQGKEVRPFGREPGTRLALLARAAPPYAIVSLDTQRSPLDVMRDGTGFFLPRPRWQPQAAVSADGQTALLEMHSPGTPSPRAAALIGMGRLAVTVAGGSVTLRSREFKLRKGAEFRLGEARLVITDVKPGRPSSITLRAGPAFAALKALRCVVGDQVVPVTQWSIRSDIDAFFITFEADLPAKGAILEAEVWQDLRSLAVPFAVQPGVGLDRPRVVTLDAPPPARDIRPFDLSLAGLKVAGPGAPEGEGTGVALALTVAPPHTIVSLDGESLELLDAAGVRLAEPQLQVHRTAGATAALLELRAQERPPPDAGSLTARGALNVVVAAGVETVRVPRVLLSVGDTFRLAGQVMTVSEVQTLQGEIRFTVEGPAAVVDTVRAVRFQPRGQAAAPAAERGRRPGPVRSALALRVAGPEPAGDFEIEMWKQPRRVRLPFEVRVGLGRPALSSAHP